MGKKRLTLSECYDMRYGRMLSKLKSSGKRMERMGLTDRGSEMRELLSCIYCWIRIADDYIEEQKGSLMVRGEVHRKCVEDFEQIRPEVESLLRKLPQLFPAEERGRVKPSKYVGKDYFDPLMEEESRLIRENGFAFADELPEVIGLLEGRLAGLKEIETVAACENWVAEFRKGKDEWLLKEDNDSIIESFHSKYHRRLSNDLFIQERNRLHEEYVGKCPLVAIHDKYGSSEKKLVKWIRKGDYRETDFDLLYEYLHKLDVLEMLCDSQPIGQYNDDTPAKVAGTIFREDRVRRASQLTFIRKWLKTLVVTNPKNSLFVPYYVLWACGLLSNEKIPAFVRQLGKWYPELMPTDEAGQKLICKAINTQYEKVKGNGTGLPPYEGLLEHLKRYIQQEKARSLYAAIQKAYALLYRESNGWK